ncbi:centrosomal of 89 kDa [Brachionus plicatilis]|uniref:Centrosomal of 89 kDa n=1 Tax=Brachionus plicatilis TaxID=10195 RepID=A0A3M7SQZ1_BRAPC|nr:centrosomal of 89 kDa [Brachionus plicatilis]
MKLMRLKIDEITNKFNILIEENQNLHSKLQNLPENIKNQLVQIKSQAELVLEENKFLSEKLSLEEKKVYDSEKFKLEEISRLSKRILNCEVERMELLNKIDMLEANNEEIVKKFNQSSVEMQRRIKLDDHLTQIGDLKRKMEELNLSHKHETELLLLKVQAYEDEKKKFIIKLTDSEAEIKRFKAENMVLDEALNKGIGHRAQKRLKDLNRSLEMGKINESKFKKRIEHLEKELEKIKFEKKMLENLVETSEADFRGKEKRIEELIAKNAQIEEAFNEFKDKASLKLANLMEKLKRKDSELVNLRVENEKKIAKILKLSEKKYKSIGDAKESKDNEVLIDNKFLKQVLQELKS